MQSLAIKKSIPLEGDYYSGTIAGLREYGVGESLLLIADNDKKKQQMAGWFPQLKTIHTAAPAWDKLAACSDYTLDLCAPLTTPHRYSAVLCHGVLEHVVDPVAALNNMATLLLPDGILYVLTHNFPSPDEQQEQYEYHGTDAVPDFFRFSSEWFRRLPMAGLALIEAKVNFAMINIVWRKASE